MATSLKSEVCEVVEDKGIPSSEMKARLSEFLKKKSTQEGLSEDDYSRLLHLKEALETASKEQPKK